MELIGLYLVGLRPLGRGRGGQGRPPRRHGPSPGRAVGAASGCGPPGRPDAVRSCEAASGGGHRLPAYRSRPALVAGSFAGFAVVVAFARHRGGAIASCGCFGTPDTPATLVHVAVNTGLAAGRGRRRRGPDRAARSSPSSPGSRGTALPLLLLSARRCLADLPGHRGAGRAPGRPDASPVTAIRGASAMTTTLVERASSFLEPDFAPELHQSLGLRRERRGDRRRLDLVLKPGTAYGPICSLRQRRLRVWIDLLLRVQDSAARSTAGTTTARATRSWAVGGKRTTPRTAAAPLLHGLQRHVPVRHRLRRRMGILRARCDGTNCGCGPDGCDSYLTGCLQFRYGQCNQDVDCIGRIVCRVVACVPPWEVDPTCTTANAEDDATAEQNAACWTPAPPPPPPPPCGSPADPLPGRRHGVQSRRRRLRADDGIREALRLRGLPDDGDESGDCPEQADRRHGRHPAAGLLVGGRRRRHLHLRRRPVLRLDGRPGPQPADGGDGRHPHGRGYWFVAADGGIFSFGDARSTGPWGPGPQPAHCGHGRHPDGRGLLVRGRRRRHLLFRRRRVPRLDGGQSSTSPMVGMAATPTGRGYWFVAADGGIFSFGDAGSTARWATRS